MRNLKAFVTLSFSSKGGKCDRPCSQAMAAPCDNTERCKPLPHLWQAEDQRPNITREDSSSPRAAMEHICIEPLGLFVQHAAGQLDNLPTPHSRCSGRQCKRCGSDAAIDSWFWRKDGARPYSMPRFWHEEPCLCDGVDRGPNQGLFCPCVIKDWVATLALGGTNKRIYAVLAEQMRDFGLPRILMGPRDT